MELSCVICVEEKKGILVGKDEVELLFSLGIYWYVVEIFLLFIQAFSIHLHSIRSIFKKEEKSVTQVKSNKRSCSGE